MTSPVASAALGNSSHVSHTVCAYSINTRCRTHVLLTLVVAIAAACGGGSSPDTPVTSPNQPPVDGAAGGTRQALPPAATVHPDAQDLRIRPFDRALSDETDDSFHVLLAVGREPCYALGRIDVDESATEVTITVFEGHLPTEGETACPDDARLASVPIDLDAPLGDRDVIDGATGDAVVVDVIRHSSAPVS